MARHSVIIGVGGTGTYILTLIKKELLEINRGQKPDNVKLLAFDTLPEAGAGGQQDLPENVISIQNVKLEQDVEFIGLSGNGWALGEAAVKGEAPHLSRWFDAAYYQTKMPPALWDLGGGAGRIRQFGRLAFYMKVNGIRERIKNAFTEIAAKRAMNEEVEVIIVSSFAGGTGAGMLVDMGVTCRELGTLFNNQLVIRGIFVLPTAFVSMSALDDEGRSMMARSFATWRELDRFMNLGPKYGEHVIPYKPEGLDIQVASRPFDECFLVDRRSDNNSLETVDAKCGVFPAVANFISLLLDNQAGKVFAERDRNYIVPLNQRAKKQGYTALRTYTVKVPIYYDMEIRALTFASEMMKRWLIPLTNVSGNITGLADNQNNEMPNTQGRDQVIPFLQATSQRVAAVTDRMSVAGGAGAVPSLNNTYLLPYIAEVYALKNNPSALQDKKDTDKLGGYVGDMVSEFSFAGKMVVLPQDYNKTNIKVNGVEKQADSAGMIAECNTHLWDEVRSSEEYGDHPLDALNRFQSPTEGLQNFERTHLGAGAGNSGKFGQAMLESRLFQVARFRELLRQWVLNTLNGTQLDPFMGLAGKLGYTNDFCDELVNALDFFTNNYLQNVKKLRDGLFLIDAANANEQNAQAAMEEWAGRKCAFFFTHPRAYVRQNQYLLAADDRIQVQRDDMVLDAMMNTGKEMLEEARRAQAAVKAWVAALATGGQNTIGLYKDLSNESARVAGNLAAEQQSSPTQMMTPTRTYTTDLPSIDLQMKRISWDVDVSNGFKVKCAMAVPTDATDSEGRAISQNEDLTSGDTQADLRHNKEIVKKVCRNVYRYEWDQRMALDEAMRLQPNAQALAVTMKNNCDILARLNTARANTGEYINSVYLRVMDPAKSTMPNPVEYVTAMNNKVCETLGMAISDITVPSEDQYKITLLRTTHRIQDSDFEIWGDLHKLYKANIANDNTRDGAARMHIFPAERNSVRYESQLTSKLNKGYRAFHPEVVMLMEHADRLSLFFRCLAYGFIKTGQLPNSEQKVYYLDVPEIGSEFDQKINLVTTSLTDDGQFREPTWFEVVNAFAMVGEDYKNNRKINWGSLRKAIALYEMRLRNKGELTGKIRYQVDDNNGIVKKLNTIAREKRRAYQQRIGKEPPEGTWTWNDDGSEYYDLEDLAHMMYLDVLDEQRHQVSNVNQPDEPEPQQGEGI